MYAELTIDQGTTFDAVLDLTNDDGTPLNLANTGNGEPVFTSQIRKSYYSSAPTANITVSILTPNTNGQVRLTMTAAATANVRAGRYLYDLKMLRYDSNSNTTIRVVEGIVTVTPQVTTT
jgi:hypothetical protein